MALATSYASHGMRPAMHLPTIKCSSCAADIEIAAMGDHICGKEEPWLAKADPAAMVNPFTMRQLNAREPNAWHAPPPIQYNQAPSQPRTRAPPFSPQHEPALSKPLRIAPPRIDPGFANKPFLAPKSPRYDTPLSPAISARSYSSKGSRGPPTRAGPRIFDPRPPSPEMSAGFDCAFPSFPVASTSSGRPGTSNGRKTPTSDRAPSRGPDSRREDGVGGEKENFRMEPKSPGGNQQVLQRMNTLKSGPFDVRKPSNNERAKQASQPPDRRRPTLPDVQIPGDPLPRPSTAHSNYSSTVQPNAFGNNSSRFGGPIVRSEEPQLRPRLPAEAVPSPIFLDKLSSEPMPAAPSTYSSAQPILPLTSSDRSRTFPVRQASKGAPVSSHALAKAPSQPNLRDRQWKPTAAVVSRTELAPATQTQQASRSDSRVDSQNEARKYNAPPVSRPVQQYRQESIHTPSESGSSTYSSANSSNNTGLSPAVSAASSVDPYPSLSHESHERGENGKIRSASANVRAPPLEEPGMRAEQRMHRSQSRSIARPNPTAQSTMPEFGMPLDTPMDSASQDYRLGQDTYQAVQASKAQGQRPTANRTQTAPYASHRSPAQQTAYAVPSHEVPRTYGNEYDQREPSLPQSTTRAIPKPDQAAQYQAFAPPTQTQSRSRQPDPATYPTSQAAPQQPSPSRRAAIARPACRGCNHTIEGKSVKAADGRLTGRWHKACFTCRKCAQPFTTADFYVLHDQPYCEQHYHEENGSLCFGCDRGIEGQYLETTSSTAAGNVDRKFHPRCFSCSECRQVLADDYFEIAGRVYCERHALAAMRGQARLAGPGGAPPDRKGLMAERRTTRLMMM